MPKAKIIVSSNSGFCFGVERALDIAEKALKKHKKVYSLGPIIHNPQVVDEFSKKGLRIVKDIEKLRARCPVALIPSHGISPRLLDKRKLFFVDTTCPLVGNVRALVKGLREKGYFIIIVGDKKHPEVKGLVGIAGRRFCKVIKDKKEAKGLRADLKRVALISQTTASLTNFKRVASILARKDFAKFTSFNTVCKNTIARENEAGRIAKGVDAMIVIGGRKSANTSKLARVCRKANKNTCHVESERDLKKTFLKGKKKIGIATGASTPPYAIREVVERIRGFEN